MIFLVVLIIVHLITARISDSVLDSRVGAIDRILGLAFGMVRGFVLIVIPYMFAVSFVCKDNPARSSAQGCRPGELPGWVENAVASVEGVGHVKVNLTFDPPWTVERMSDEAKLALNMF